MRRKDSSALVVCIIIALSLVITGLITQSTILYAFALAVISVGLGLTSLLITIYTDKRTTDINHTLVEVRDLQEKLSNAQREDSRSPIIPTLQAFSQLYMDYLAKQQTSKENKNGGKK
jgi:hypothetical protein